MKKKLQQKDGNHHRSDYATLRYRKNVLKTRGDFSRQDRVFRGQHL